MSPTSPAVRRWRQPVSDFYIKVVYLLYGVVTCSDSAVNYWLAAAAAALATAIGFVIAAIVANNSFWAAVASPGLMLAAGLAAAAAGLALNQARAAMRNYYQCLLRSGAIGSQCEGALLNWERNLLAIELVLGILAGSCATAAIVAWVPWAGQASMWPILGSLIALAPLIASLFYFTGTLRRCLPDPPPDIKQALLRAPVGRPLRPSRPKEVA